MASGGAASAWIFEASTARAATWESQSALPKFAPQLLRPILGNHWTEMSTVAPSAVQQEASGRGAGDSASAGLPNNDTSSGHITNNVDDDNNNEQSVASNNDEQCLPDAAPAPAEDSTGPAPASSPLKRLVKEISPPTPAKPAKRTKESIQCAHAKETSAEASTTKNGRASPALSSSSSSASRSSPAAGEGGEGSTKDKTPMCLVNELARFNNVQHQYRLIEEQGPPHKKTFTVVLKLGSQEEYTATGSSIKRARHSAAQMALQKSALKHPTPKSLGKGSGGPLTPTVELNALAMKRGEPAVYRVVEIPRLASAYMPIPLGYHRPYSGATLYGAHVLNHSHPGSQRYHPHFPPRLPPSYRAILDVGERKFIGEGNTEQAARHSAAEVALATLRALPLPASAGRRSTSAASGDDDDHDDEAKSAISVVYEMALKRNLQVDFEVVSESGPPHMRKYTTRCQVGDVAVTEGCGNGKKVSKKEAAEKMVAELRRLMPATHGPAAGAASGTAAAATTTATTTTPTTTTRTTMATATTTATTTTPTTVGGGGTAIGQTGQQQNGLQRTTKTAVATTKVTIDADSAITGTDPCADANVTVVDKTNNNSNNKKKSTPKKKSKNVIKEQRPDGTCYGQGINPISRLIQIQQAKKENEPVYTVIAERGEPRSREFVIQCSIDGGAQTTDGTGPNKKTAKRKAAEAMLLRLGYAKPAAQQAGSNNKEGRENVDTSNINGGSNGGKTGAGSGHCRQLAPGLLVVSKEGKDVDKHQYEPNCAGGGGGDVDNVEDDDRGCRNLHCIENRQSAIAKELLDSGVSPTAMRLDNQSKDRNANPGKLANRQTSAMAVDSSSSSSIASQGSLIKAKDQLSYLAQVLGIQVSFMNFPKGNEFLSLVALTSNPPQQCHGSGRTIEEAQDNAARSILISLAQLGIDSIQANNNTNSCSNSSNTNNCSSNNHNNSLDNSYGTGSSSGRFNDSCCSSSNNSSSNGVSAHCHHGTVGRHSHNHNHSRNSRHAEGKQMAATTTTTTTTMV